MSFMIKWPYPTLEKSNKRLILHAKWILPAVDLEYISIHRMNQMHSILLSLPDELIVVNPSSIFSNLDYPWYMYIHPKNRHIHHINQFEFTSRRIVSVIGPIWAPEIERIFWCCSAHCSHSCRTRSNWWQIFNHVLSVLDGDRYGVRTLLSYRYFQKDSEERINSRRGLHTRLSFPTINSTDI